MIPRKFERFSVNGMVTFVGDSVRGGGQIDNLSLGGAAIASDVPVTRGDYLQLTMTLPSEPAAIDVELAPVRWVKDHSFGVEFIRVSPTALQILQRYIERLGLVPDEPASANS
jgi:hypothetical protein